jgi:hypothetical protein
MVLEMCIYTGAPGLCVCQYQVGWEKIVLDKGVLDTSIACVLDFFLLLSLLEDIKSVGFCG